MKALVKYASGEGNVEVRDVGEPPCGPNEVKVEIAFCGVCGTDLHVVHDTYPNYPPVILGHEAAGTVVEVGREVKSSKVGDPVTILGATSVTCGTCTYCRTGHFIFCKIRRGMGHGVNGAFARYLVKRPDQLYKIPEGFALDEAALTEPFAAALQAVVELGQVQFGDTALVSGPGPIGLLCLKLLVAQGVKTIVVGAADDHVRLQAALAMGAASVVNVGERNLKEAILDETGGLGADVAFECAGHPASVRGALEALRPMGRYVQVAICGRDVPLPVDQLLFKQITMVGSICYTAATWDRAMRIFAQGKLRLNDLISVKVPLTEWRTGFDLCADKGALKVLIYPE